MSIFDSIKYQVPEAGTTEYVNFLVNDLPAEICHSWTSNKEYQEMNHISDINELRGLVTVNRKLLIKIIHEWETT